MTTRRVCQEFAARHENVAVEYVNLKACRSIFSAASEIHLELTGASVGAYEGLDGAFTGIWDALEAYPTWTVLILDEIDHIAQDGNYDPSDFLYRLLRGEGKLERDIQLSAWLISNELLEVDLRLDSRVESAMSDEQVFFPPYGVDDLAAVVGPQLDAAFIDGRVPEDVLDALEAMHEDHEASLVRPPEEGDAPADAAGDLAPEGLTFISEEASPIDAALLAVGFEVSGTTGLFKIGTVPPGRD